MKFLAAIVMCMGLGTSACATAPAKMSDDGHVVRALSTDEIYVALRNVGISRPLIADRSFAFYENGDYIFSGRITYKGRYKVDDGILSDDPPGSGRLGLQKFYVDGDGGMYSSIISSDGTESKISKIELKKF